MLIFRFDFITIDKQVYHIIINLNLNTFIIKLDNRNYKGLFISLNNSEFVTLLSKSSLTLNKIYQLDTNTDSTIRIIINLLQNNNVHFRNIYY